MANRTGKIPREADHKHPGSIECKEFVRYILGKAAISNFGVKLQYCPRGSHCLSNTMRKCTTTRVQAGAAQLVNLILGVDEGPDYLISCQFLVAPLLTRCQCHRN